jgi:Ca2+-binding RTX toxin-like protein
MNADGSGRRPLTNNSFPEFDPAWSPDGTRITFESSRRLSPWLDTDQNIYVMDADGNNQRGITTNICAGGTCSYQGHDADPAWSPNGEKIAYAHSGGDIWTIDPSGSNRAPLSETRDITETMPAWSPNGGHIAYVHATSTDRNIAVMNADGTNQRVIAADTAHDIRPDWQPLPVCTNTVNANNDPLVGTAGKDVLCGDSRNNTINAAGGDDIVLAQGGNDKLTGALGNDTINGGPEADTALYSGTTAVEANLTTEFATGVGMDVLLGIENLSGSGANDRLTGSAAANRLVGGAGSDVLSGLGGADTLNSKDGVSGNDTLDGGAGTDTKITDATEKSIVGFP